MKVGRDWEGERGDSWIHKLNRQYQFEREDNHRQ